MTNSKIKISIVIATKDRYETLYSCIDSLLLNYSHNDVEIIVRDNSATPQVEEFKYRYAAQNNIVYVHDSIHVSQSGNVDKAVQMARGEFVTWIGDDDGIAGGLLEIVEWMGRKQIDAIYPGFSTYLWPGVSLRYDPSTKQGHLYTPELMPPRLTNVQEQRSAVLAAGCTSLECLPRLYYGVVRKALLDQLRLRAGDCFPGPSPDMANAFALSYLDMKFVVTTLPIFIAGNSKKSAAGLGLRGRHIGEIDTLPFLPSETGKMWNRRIPYFWSGPTIWCQSAYSAAKRMGDESQFNDKNSFKSLYGRLFVFHIAFAISVVDAIKSQELRGFNLIKEIWLVSLEVLKTISNRFVNFFYNRFSRSRKEKSLDRSINSIVDATKAIDDLMSSIDLESFLAFEELKCQRK